MSLSLDETRFRAALGMVGMNYPPDLFPPDGKSQDCLSARMVRLTLDNVWREYEKLKEAEAESAADQPNALTRDSATSVPMDSRGYAAPQPAASLLDEAHILICQAVASRNNGGTTTVGTHDGMRAWLEKFADRAADPTSEILSTTAKGG